MSYDTSQVIVLLSSSLSIESDSLRPGLHNNLPSVSHQTRSTCATLTGSNEKSLLCVLVSSLQGISAGEFDSFRLCHQYWNLQKNNFRINSGFFHFCKNDTSLDLMKKSTVIYKAFSTWYIRETYQTSNMTSLPLLPP